MSKIILILSALLLVACGTKKKRSESYEYIPQVEKSVYDSLIKIDLSLDTPEGVGTLLTYKDSIYSETGSVSMCTWSLVGEDLALTNSHCLPDIVKNSQNVDCGNYMRGVFKIGDEVVNTKCKKVIKFSDIEISGQSVGQSNDYAVIRLDKKFGKSYFEFSRSGVLENQKVISYTMNHKYNSKENRVNSTFLEHKCVLKSSDVFGEIQSLGTSPVYGYREKDSDEYCKPVGGNSGSPILNESNRLIGVLHAGVNREMFDFVKMTSPAAYKQLSGEFLIMTNLRCFSFGVEELDISLEGLDCKNISRKKVPGSEIEKRAIRTIEDFKQKMIKDASYSLKYEIREMYDERTRKAFFILVPKCIKPFLNWSSRDSSNVYWEEQKHWSGKRRSKVYYFKLKSYDVDPEVIVDYYGNYNYELNPKLRSENEFKLFNLDLLDKKKSARITKKGSLHTLGTRGSQFIPMCR